MRISYSWLSQYISGLPEPQQVVEALTSVGLEVEEILDFSYLKNFSVARISDAQKHPNADTLSVCKVDTGSETLDIVCGAPNVRPGLFVALAPVGSTLPCGITIKKAKIRGAISNGMMCSREELNLSSRASRGIMELEEAPLGTDLFSALDLTDPIFNVFITPDRSDCFGVQGIARDLAAKLRLPLNLPEKQSVPHTFTSDITVTCAPDAHKACPLFLTRVIRGVKNPSSPHWLQKRVREAGGSPISALVDITNFFLFDACRPLHVFDYKKLAKKKIHIRLSKEGEPFEGLDGKTYNLPQDSIVVTDGDDAIAALAGILGASYSGSYEDTTDVVLECAVFDPEHIRRTGQQMHLLSEARTRFERGVNFHDARALLESATKMILDICGGEAGSIVEHTVDQPKAAPITVDPALYTRFIGAPYPETAPDTLQRLGYTAGNNHTWTPPTWRHDITDAEDVYADIWRITGADSIPEAPLPITQWHDDTLTDCATKRIRTTLSAMGYHEIVPYMMISSHLYETFGASPSEPHITNPISQDLAYIRQNLASTLALAAKTNVDHKATPFRLFEIGPVYSELSPAGRTMRIGGICCGPFHAEHWNHPTQTASPASAKEAISAILSALNLDPSLVLASTEGLPAYCTPGQSAHLLYNDKPLGVVGALSPNIVDSLMKTTETLCFFELHHATLMNLTQQAHDHATIAQSFPYHDIHRDLAFMAPKTLKTQELLATIKEEGSPLVQRLSVFDYFTGKGVPEGHVSIGLRLVLNSSTEQLQEHHITECLKRVIKRATEQFPISLRQ